MATVTKRNIPIGKNLLSNSWCLGIWSEHAVHSSSAPGELRIESFQADPGDDAIRSQELGELGYR